MTTQAAVAAQPAANGSAAGGSAAAVKREPSPAPPEAAKAAAAAAAGTSSADGARRSGSPAGAAAAGDASARATPEAAAGAAGAADAAPSKEDEQQRKLEDEILAEGQAIAGVRALLAKAFSRPAEEPAVPMGHWGFLLREMEWLANDMAQERLWKQAAAMAVAFEVARMRGKFKLKPPPEGQRRYHDELAALRAAAVKEAAGEKAGGRRGASKAAATDASAAAALKLDPADDPIWRDMEEFSKELQLPATPPTDDLGKALALTWQHDAEFQAALEEQLMQSDVERMMKEEMAAREYRFEYEAALASHHMAVQEQNRRAMRLDADMADAEGLLPMDEDEAEDEVGGKKSKARKRARSGYLLDDLASVGAAPDETDSMPKGGPKAPGRQFIEDTYLQRKRRRERYKDVDVDYDVGMETAGRYGTRGNRQMATRAGASRAQDPNKRKQQAGQEAFAVGGGGGQGAMARHGAVRPTHPQGAVPGPVIWSKSEDDLLLAITHEFGVNWTMVSEVLSLSLSMQGIFRPPHLCKQRFRQITTPLLQQQAQQQLPPGTTEVPNVEYSEDKALMALYMAMSKQQARELIVMSLPVHDDVMMRMLEALVQVGATAKQRRQLEEKRNEVRKIAEPHPSHATVHQLVMAKTNNEHLTPVQLAHQVDVAYAQQAKQHQMLAQQAQQAAQLQAQGAPPPPGQQAAAAAAAAAASQPQGAAPGAQQAQQQAQKQAQQAGAPSPAVGMPAAGGAPGVASGTPAGAAGLAAQQQAQQQQGMPSSATPPLPAGLPGQPGSAGTPAAAGLPPPGQGAPSPVGAPGHAPAPRPQQQQITLQQLNHILDSGKLPNGQPLEPSMRKAIEDKKNAYLAQMAAMQQRQQQMMMQQAAGGAAGGAPGQGPSAAQAAMQAAQQAAAVQAGMRPAMPMGGAPMFRPGLPPGAGGMPGMQAVLPGAGMAGQAMGMQPGLLQQQMMGAPGMGMQAMQPGMQQMSAAAAAQQQAIMQQFAMQQQAQMAAAAQAQPGAQPPGA